MGNSSILSERIKALRLETGKTQQDICNAIHVEQVTLSQYETGKRIPKLEILISLAKYYNVTIDYLVGITHQKTPFYNNVSSLSEPEQKILKSFRQLNADNQDIIIGETKKLLKEQLKEEQDNESALKKAE